MIIKNLLTLLYIGVALFLNLIFGTDASVGLFVPDEVEAGNKFQVILTVDKGAEVQGFARFQQLLPHGLKATKSESENSEFVFKDHKVKFLWLNLPAREQLKLSYYLEVDERVMGNFNMGGTFSYISENQRTSVNVPSKIIHINPSPNVDYSVDINEFREDYLYDKPMEDLIACIRQKPYLDKVSNEYVVNLLVYKKDKEKFAKIEEMLPIGVKAYAEESTDPIFTFKNNTAKYIWMDLPENPYFVISYNLSPNEVSVDKIGIDGQFSYVEDETTQIVEIVERGDIDLTNTDINYLKSVVESSRELISKANRSSKAGIEKPETKDKVEKPKTKDKVETKKSELTPILDPVEGVYYRVQLAAGHKPVDINKYFKKYKLKHKVKLEQHEGWYKYSIGAFKIYKDARDYRVYIWNSTVIDDAFVAAYNNGTRITVQEALMIANHKWYK
ncbi:hypothetical protein ACFLTE_07430 [Bacteroidota bacterium]